MCLIGFNWLSHPRWRLVLAGNRDEFHDRPARAAGWWPDAPGVFGGRDLEAGGSWLALDRRGRLAVVTNFREPGAPPGPRSRGELVSGFVRSDESIDHFADRVAERPDDWSGYNLLLFDLSDGGFGQRALYLSNRAPASPVSVAPGLHGLSNHLLDTGWPKVRLLRQRIERALQSEAPERLLFEALADPEPAPDEQLPATGVELARERLLSPALIRADGYGTRASTVVLVDHEGRVEFVERSWSPLGDTPVSEKRASFAFDPPAGVDGPVAPGQDAVGL